MNITYWLGHNSLVLLHRFSSINNKANVYSMKYMLLLTWNSDPHTPLNWYAKLVICKNCFPNIWCSNSCTNLFYLAYCHSQLDVPNSNVTKNPHIVLHPIINLSHDKNLLMSNSKFWVLINVIKFAKGVSIQFRVVKLSHSHDLITLISRVN